MGMDGFYRLSRAYVSPSRRAVLEEVIAAAVFCSERPFHEDRLFPAWTQVAAAHWRDGLPAEGLDRMAHLRSVSPSFDDDCYPEELGDLEIAEDGAVRFADVEALVSASPRATALVLSDLLEPGAVLWYRDDLSMLGWLLEGPGQLCPIQPALVGPTGEVVQPLERDEAASVVERQVVVTDDNLFRVSWTDRECSWAAYVSPVLLGALCFHIEWVAVRSVQTSEASDEATHILSSPDNVYRHVGLPQARDAARRWGIAAIGGDETMYEQVLLAARAAYPVA